MPTYKFRCDECGVERIEVMSFKEHAATRGNPGHWLLDPAAGCRGILKQVFDFQFHRGMPEHYNASLGARVSTPGQIQSALSRQSDEMSARMGFDHHYELVDPHDPQSAGVTEQGMEETRKRARDTGATTATKKIVV